MKNIKLIEKLLLELKNNPESLLGIWVTFGILFGLAIDNIGVGIAIGVAIGVSLYQESKKTKSDKTTTNEQTKKGKQKD